jgi:hypothetical protein
MRIISLFLLLAIACSDVGSNSNQSLADSSENGQNVSVPHGIYIYSLAEKYGKAKTLTALYFTNKAPFSKIFHRVDSLELIYCQLESFFDRNKQFVDSAFDLVGKFYGTSTDHVSADSVNVKTWLENDDLLSSSLAIKSDDLFFNEIIDEIPNTKSIITRYLKDPRQYWGSLDENTSCKVYYDVLLYLGGQNKRERQSFFREYFRRILDDQPKAL